MTNYLNYDAFFLNLILDSERFFLFLSLTELFYRKLARIEKRQQSSFWIFEFVGGFYYIRLGYSVKNTPWDFHGIFILILPGHGENNKTSGSDFRTFYSHLSFSVIQIRIWFDGSTNIHDIRFIVREKNSWAYSNFFFFKVPSTLFFFVLYNICFFFENKIVVRIVTRSNVLNKSKTYDCDGRKSTAC